MVIEEWQVFRCQNRECGCEIRVPRSSMDAQENPWCRCGAGMKKLYYKPSFCILNSDRELAAVRSNKN
jgi:hypothetical protein